MSDLDQLLREAEARVHALEQELAADERELEKALTRAAKADANVERWWFGGGRLQRLWVGSRLRRAMRFIVK